MFFAPQVDRSTTRIRGRLAVLLSDSLLFALSAFFAFQLRFDGRLPATYLHPLGVAICVWTGAKSVAFLVGTVNRGFWRFASVHEVMRIFLVNSTGSIVGGIAISLVLGPRGVPRSVYILEWLISSLLTLASRFAVRVIAVTKRGDQSEGARTRIFIYGAGAAGVALVRELRQNQALMCDVRGLVDDDPRKLGLTFHGKRVLGSGESLQALVMKHAIKRVLVAIPSATGAQMTRILTLAVHAGIDYKMVPSLGEIVRARVWERRFGTWRWKIC